MAKINTHFQAKTAQKPYPLVRHIPSIKEKNCWDTFLSNEIYFVVSYLIITPSDKNTPSPPTNVGFLIFLTTFVLQCA